MVYLNSKNVKIRTSQANRASDDELRPLETKAARNLVESCKTSETVHSTALHSLHFHIASSTFCLGGNRRLLSFTVLLV